MNAKWMLTLLLCAGCGYGAWPDAIQQGPTGARNERRIEAVLYYGSRSAWLASPWYRIDGEQQPPVFLVVADGGWACEVDAAVWTLAQPGDWVRCPGRWLAPR